MLDIRKLRMLEALDRLGTVAAVAEELRLTAPGISMQLGGLERELGVPVTERRGRRLALTPAGRLLVTHTREVLDRLSLAEHEIDALRRGSTGTYRVAAFPSAAGTFVADAWRGLIDDGSGIELRLTTPEPEDAISALTAGHVDLAVVHSYSNVPRSLPHGIEAEPLASEVVWVAIRADDPAAADTIDLSSLAEHDWITPDDDVTCYEMIDRACGLAGFRPRAVARSMDFAAQLELVAAGVGVALMPQLTIAHVPDGVRLARTTSMLRRHLHAARRTSLRGDAGLDRIVEALAAAAEHRTGLPAVH